MAENRHSIMLEKPPNTRMFNVPPSGQKCHQSASVSAPPMPSITVNIPDILGSHVAHSNLQPSWSLPIASDPADYIDKPWPTLHDFLHSIEGKDRHKHDFTSHAAALREQEILGPDDIARCSVDELHDWCNIPIRKAKLLAAEGQRVTEEVKLEVRACKHRQDHWFTYRIHIKLYRITTVLEKALTIINSNRV